MSGGPSRPPATLGPRGRRFWRSTVGDFDLSEAEREILLEVCRTLDDLDRLDAMVVELGATVVGSNGQPVVNPALTEGRGQRAILHRLVAALQLPDADDADPNGPHAAGSDGRPEPLGGSCEGCGLMARRRTVERSSGSEGIPPEFASPLDPFWRDAARIRARFPEYFDGDDEQRLRMGARAHGSVVARWCLANGFESTRWPGFVDWHALRA